jgi:hypothetical protein
MLLFALKKTRICAEKKAFHLGFERARRNFEFSFEKEVPDFRGKSYPQIFSDLEHLVGFHCLHTFVLPGPSYFGCVS